MTRWKPEYAEARRRRRDECPDARMKSREANRRWKKRNPDRVREDKRSRQNASNAKKLAEMAGRPKSSTCEICGVAEDGTRATQIMFDHCHATGRFRGWICHRCNVALGYIKDNVQVARRIVAYLEDGGAR